MFHQLQNYLQYDFMRYALIVGPLVTICSALLGVTLVLRRYSMIGDGLSHVGFGALGVAAALHWAPLPVAVPAVIAAAFLLLRSRHKKMQGDAAIALFSATCLALGVLAITISGGSNVDLMNYMFGSILALSKSDVWIAAGLFALVLPGFAWLYHRIFSVTFDEPFARATGLRTGLYQLLTALFTSLTIVLGMRLLGTLLISSLLTFPAMISMRLFKSFRAVVLSAAVTSVVCFVAGFLISLFWKQNLPTGATIVAVYALAFGAFSLAGWVRGRSRKNC
ncbi:MAG: metal ABC transporter permease [Oscillospiraceae bacterium]|jgi:zinc transport system permease protein|nr:metal ABC transporter permease [Oscillospiraceae bacterium]